MKKANNKFRRAISFILSLSLMLTTLNGLVIPAAAATATSGIDENGFTYTSDGTSVTITGHNKDGNNTPFYGFESNGHYYGLSIESKSWANAKADCEEKGGHLVTITSAEEQAVIKDLLSYAPTSNRWIGANLVNGVWQWANDEVFEYTNWAPGEPNGSATTGIIYYDGRNNFLWDDSNASSAYYICEWEVEPSKEVFTTVHFYGIEYNGHYYGLSMDSKTWLDAKAECESKGGHLVYIEDETEQKALESLFKYCGTDSKWIGAYLEDGLWQWANGETVGYSNWDKNEPNGSGNYAQIYGTNYLWDDVNTKSDSYSQKYICEWEEKPEDSIFYKCKTDLVTPSEINGVPVTTIAENAFKDKPYLTSIQLADSITTIGSYAFNDCSGLTEIELPKNLTTIRMYAFKGCSGISEINLPQNIQTIEQSAFMGTHISSIVIPNSVTTLYSRTASYNDYYSAFCDAGDLREVIFEDGRTAIPTYALAGCSQITSVEIPNSVTNISSYAFRDCSSLTSVDLPEAVTTIGDYAFAGCKGLTSIDIPDAVTTIGSCAFNDCSGLTEIELPETLTTIGSYAFNDCSGLTEIELPKNLTTIRMYAFKGCSGISEINLPQNIQTIEQSAFMGTHISSIVIPNSVTTLYSRTASYNDYYSAFCDAGDLREVIFEDGRTAIPTYALAGCSQITSVEIPNSVTNISSYAFRDCSSLTSVDLPEAVTTIGDYAFAGCKGLTSIDIPDAVTTIGSCAFNDCSGLTEIELPETLTTIGSYAFNDCSGLTEIELPKNLTTIRMYAFKGCSGISEINLPQNIQTIEQSAFMGTHISSIVIPNSVTTLYSRTASYNDYYSAFCDAGDLREVIFEDGRTAIPTYALAGCSQITSVEIPNSVTNISSYAFRDCSSLTSVDLPEAVTTIGDYAFAGCKGLTSIDIPDAVTTIGSCAFNDCSGLTEIELPETLTTIGSYAFNDCSGLTEIELPKNLTTIRMYAFKGCSGISEINLPQNIQTIEQSAFMGTHISSIVIPNSVTTLYSRTASYNDYYSAFCDAGDLREVIFEDGRTAIPTYALAGCSQITSVEIPNSVTNISSYAFRDCSSLTSVDLPEAVTTIGDYAFAGCKGLTSIDIPDAVTTIGSCAFNDCSGLTEIELPETLTTIGSYAFNDCSGLTEIELPKNLTTIRMYAFKGCSGISEINLPQNIQTIEQSAFMGTHISSIVIPNSVTTLYSRTASYNDYYSAFCDAGDLREVIFEDGRTAIPTYALAGCSQITSVEIPNSVTNISSYAFRDCSSLTSVDLPEAVTTIGDYAFNGCTKLTSLNIQAGEYSHTSQKIEAEKVNVISGNPNWSNSNASGGYCVDYAYDLNFNVIVDTKGSFELHEVAPYNNRSFKLYIDGEYYGTYYGNGTNNATFTDFTIAQIKLDEGTHNVQFKQNSGYPPIYDYFLIIPVGEAKCQIENGETVDFYKGLKNINANAFANCNALTDVYYTGSEDEWNTIKIDATNTPLINATKHFEHIHTFGEWIIDREPTCSLEGRKHKTCTDCGYEQYESIDKIPHEYESTVVPPTYLEDGYTLFTCKSCGETYKDEYVNPLERTDISSADISLEYSSAYYEGIALTPSVTILYNGEEFDAAKELKITYINNDKVGTATVTIEGINRFKGTVTLTFDISYESVPEPIVNVFAVGEYGKISLSWAVASEVTTNKYNIYRKASDNENWTLIKTVDGRNTLSYEDKTVEKEKTYFYYVTGVGTYGAESLPSEITSAAVQIDKQAPTILKMEPAAKSVIFGKTTFSVTATDNVGVTKVVYFYSVDNGNSWEKIGETSNSKFSIVFDTSVISDETVKIKAVAYDAEGNASDETIYVYSLDNIGPDKVSGLTATALSSKITLAWNDVTANDAASFVLETKTDEAWKVVAKNIKTLGYTISNLQPDTSYTYRVACVDTHGNIGEYSDEFTVSTLKDETAPVITSQSPNPSRFNKTINFSATAKDDCDIEKMGIQVSTNLIDWTTISTKTYTVRNYSQTYAYLIDLSAYSEGSIFVRAVATDFSGNISNTDKTAPYTEYIVDKTAPDAPTNVTANGNDGYITISWDMGSESDLGKYSIYKSTSLNGNYQLIASNLTSLNYHDRDVQSGREFYYKVKVADTCGNISDYSNAASATMASDSQRPEITGISTTYQQKISPSMHTVNVLATDNNKLSYILVEYCTSKNPEYTTLVKQENIDNHYKSISVALPIDNLEDGDTVYLRTAAVDMAGLRSDYATAKYTVDVTPPMVNEYSAQIDSSTVYLDWKDNGEADLSGFKLYRSNDGENFVLLGSRGKSNNGTYSFIDNITEQESNTYIYKLEALDRLGNTASWFKTVDYVYTYINQSPIAKMSIPDFVTAGVEEVFDASKSSDDIAIVNYLWDFGDGTTSREIKPVKKYESVGVYTVKLSVTDNEGITTTISKDIEVKERDLLGTLNVKVVDDSGKALSYVPVYFDLGNDNQKIIYTDATGIATLKMSKGTHIIGMYADGYLPVKKDVVVLANAVRTVTLTTVKENIVTGNFEIKRMKFDEIVAAGIDVYDPANQNVYSATVRVTYGSTPPLTINYVRNDDKIINYEVTDQNGKSIEYYTNSNGENRKITGVTYIPNSQGGQSDVVAILDIPAEASYLKEFFDVRLHIVNNASSEFSLEKNEVVLNVPEGMTLMSSVGGEYLTSNIAKIDTIKGQETVTLSWVLRGDKAGQYDLSADFVGTLAEFNELVTARFETEEPIKVYGLEGVNFRILEADEIHNDTLYFNVELENQRDIDIYMPSIGLTDKINNVTDSVLNNNADGDFLSEAYILNAYIQMENGQKQYVPITYNANGKAITAIDTLAPGQKIVYEYVAYNAINYDGVAYFKDAAITEFEGIIENIETGFFHKELYSFNDYSEKLTSILLGNNSDVKNAFEYIDGNDNYYYVDEAENSFTNVCQALYSVTDLALNADISIFTQEEKRELVEQIVLSILADSSTVKMAEELQGMKYIAAVKNLVNQAELGLAEKYENLDFDAMMTEIKNESQSLAITYIQNGEDAFYNELYSKISEKAAKYGMGIIFDGQIESFFNDIGISETKAFSSTLIDPKAFANNVLDALDKTQRQAYIASVLKFECNVEYSNNILDAIISNASNSEMQSLIIDVAYNLKTQINKSKNECYDYAGQFYVNLGTELGEVAFRKMLQLAISSTPLSIASKIFKSINSFANFDSFYKQQDTLDVYNAMSKTMFSAFNDTTSIRNEKNDFYSMSVLKALCELRLSGEAEFKSFMNDYIEGKYALPLSESTVLKQINAVMNTSYSSIDEWYDDVKYNIVHARDILFNVEGTSFDIPKAPVVSLDYEKLQTVQSFTSDYEYCFGNGVWKKCDNKPIAFEVRNVPSVIRVRKAAGKDNLAGEITTVKILARKDLSKLIAVRFDGVNYLFENLSSKYNYQLAFVNSLTDEVNWETAEFIYGKDSVVTVSGIGEYPYVVIRSCQNAELDETTSNPLNLTVAKKKPLNIAIDGNGTILQSDEYGCYFNGESVDLIATANKGSEFIGWYINDTCVSTDNHYIAETADELQLTARFTGIKVEDISVSKLPAKLEYYEGEKLDLNGLEIVAAYSDGSSAVAEITSAYMSTNNVGKSSVIVMFGDKAATYDITIIHKESDWITTVTPTLFNEGLKVKKCLICNKVIETEVLPMLIDDSGIVVDPDRNVIYNIPENLFSSAALIDYYKDLGCRVKVLDSESNNISSVMTGGCVMYAGEKYTAIILGDTTGDGEIDIFDMLKILDNVNGDIELEGVYKEAGLIVNEEEIDVFDALAVLDYVNGDASLKCKEKGE